MKTLKLLPFCLLLVFSHPVPAFSFPVITSDIVTTDDNAVASVSVEKKKDRDIVSINSSFFLSLGLDITTVLLIVLFIYHPNYKRMDTTFTFIVFNVAIFLLTFVLNKVKISMGAAFGLFAVFSMLRYRTAGISMKDMTYLFVFIAIGLISGIQLEFAELLLINSILFLIMLLMDTRLILKRELCQYIQFEKIELVKPEFRTQLIQELNQRTGLNIHRISISKLDYLKDTAAIYVYYYE